MFGGPGAFRIGEIDGTTTPRIVALQQAFSAVQPVAVTDNIFGFLWSKIALGAIYFATATTDSDVTDLYAEARYRTLFGRLAGEVVAAADASGVRLETFDGFDPTVFGPSATPDQAAIAATWDGQNRYWNSHESKRTGVWRDLAIHKRRTEIDRQIGPVIEIGRERGVATPGLSRSSLSSRRSRAANGRSGWVTSMRSKKPGRLSGEVCSNETGGSQSLDEPLLRFVPRPKLGQSMMKLIVCALPERQLSQVAKHHRRLIVTDVVAHADQALDIRPGGCAALDSAPSPECPWRAPPLASAAVLRPASVSPPHEACVPAAGLRPHAVPRRFCVAARLASMTQPGTGSGAEVQHADEGRPHMPEAGRRTFRARQSCR